MTVEIFPKPNQEVIKVYTIDSEGFKINITGYLVEDFDESFMVPSTSNPIPSSLVKPKWEGGEWVEGASEEEFNSALNSIKERCVRSNLKSVEALCFEVADEIEQRNWINFPEDYTEEELAEKKSKIQEIRAEGRKVRASIEACSSIEELLKIDYMMGS